MIIKKKGYNASIWVYVQLRYVQLIISGSLGKNPRYKVSPCKVELETLHHILLTCHYLKAVWFSSNFWLRLDNFKNLSVKEFIDIWLDN